MTWFLITLLIVVIKFMQSETVFRTSVVGRLRLSEFVQNKLTTVYPNPNNGKFILMLNDGYTGDATLEVYSINGKLVLKQICKFENGNAALQLSINKGFYIGKITSSNNSHKIFKVLINYEN